MKINEKVKILPCTFKPKSDELFSSWLVRLAYAHNSKSHTFYKLLFPEINIWNRDIDKSVTDELIKKLSLKTLNSFETIFKTTLKNYEGRLYLKHNAYGNTKWILPIGIYHRERKSHGLVFCPLCLKKDGNHPYFRKHWRLAFSIICPHCNIFLHDRCPNCKKPIIFFRNDLGDRQQIPTKPISLCFNCQFDLVDSPIVFAPAKFARHQKTLFRILREGWNKNIFYPHLYFDVLHQLLKVLKGRGLSHKRLRADFSLRFPDLPLLNSEKAVFNLVFERQSIEIRKTLLKYAIWLLEDYPQNFLSVFKYHDFKSSDLLKDFTDIPFWFEKIVIENFYISNTNRRFILKKAFQQESIKAPIKGWVGGKRKYSDFSCPLCNSNWVIKDGLRNKKERYKCRSCNKRFFHILI